MTRPFFDARSQTAEYAGPGRDDPPPTDLKEVKIGWFGPSDADHPTAGAMWCAAQMAVEEANAAGRYNGLDFRLVPVWSENPWGSGIKGLTQLVYDEGVWALVGAPDGPSAHLAAQVVAKARLVFLSPVATDKTANLANVPWIFSCAPGDHILAPLLAQAIVSNTNGKKFAVVSCTDHDSRVFTAELLATLKELGAFPSLHLNFKPGGAGIKRTIEMLREAGATPASARVPLLLRPEETEKWVQEQEASGLSAIALISAPEDGALFLMALRWSGILLPVFGDARIGHRLLREAAGSCAEGVTFPLLWDPSTDDRTGTFARRFKDRFGFEPDYTAAQTYDAMNVLIVAIHRAGLNRARIRDAVRQLSPWSGLAGTITWDPTGHNRRTVRLGTVRNAQLILADH